MKCVGTVETVKYKLSYTKCCKIMNLHPTQYVGIMETVKYVYRYSKTQHNV